MDLKEEKQKQANKQVVIIGVVVIVVAIGFLAWRFFIDDAGAPAPPLSVIRSVPVIDFEYLETPEFNHFYRYEELEGIRLLDESELGRENPFLPY